MGGIRNCRSRRAQRGLRSGRQPRDWHHRACRTEPRVLGRTAAGGTAVPRRAPRDRAVSLTPGRDSAWTAGDPVPPCR